MKESNEDHVTFTELSSIGLELVLEFVYGGFLTLTEKNMEDIVAVASYLQIHCVLECCCDFIRETLSVENCMEYLKLASNYALDTVASDVIHQVSIIEYVDDFILANILDLHMSNDHTKIPLVKTVRKLVTSDKIQIAELTLFNIVVDWLLAEPSREGHSEEVMKYVKFTLIPQPDLERLLAEPRCDALGIRDRIDTALNYVSLPVRKKIQWDTPVDQIRGRPHVTVVFSHIWQDFNQCSRNLQVLLESNNDEDEDDDNTDDDDDDDDDISVHEFSKEAMWIQIPQLPKTFRSSSAVPIKNFLFICGGSDGRTLPAHKECHVFDPITWQWDKIAPMNVGRYAFTLVAHEEELYAIGGRTQNDVCIDSIEKYSLRDNCWEIVAHYIAPAAHVAAVSATGLLYMYGGETDNTSSVVSFKSFDPRRREWKSLPLCPGIDVMYSDCTLLSLQNYLCVLCPHDTRSDDMICFNINTQQWVRFSCASVCDLGDLGSFITDGRSIYCLGGDRNLRFTPDIENNACHWLYLPEPNTPDYVHFHRMCCMIVIPYDRLEEAKQKALADKKVMYCCTISSLLWVFDQYLNIPCELGQQHINRCLAPFYCLGLLLPPVIS